MIEILNKVTGAVLYRADVTTVVAAVEAAVKAGVSLSWAYLAGANLKDAYLDKTREDFYAILSSAHAEIPALWKALLDGKVDGSAYEGECACLVGTIAKARGADYRAMSPNSTRAAERWFLAIRRGDTPDNSAVSRLTVEWLREYAERESIALPSRRVVWSDAGPVS